MRELISDLLDVAQVETGTLPVDPERSDMATLIDQARNVFLSGGGRNDLHIDLAKDLPPVMADRERIVQVLSNLLSNAARYSPDSSPIPASAVLDDPYVAVSVSDEGQGLPMEHLPHLYNRTVKRQGVMALPVSHIARFRFMPRGLPENRCSTGSRARFVVWTP